MGWTDWFKRRQREIGMDYHISEDGFRCLSDDGTITAVKWEELIWVKIITTPKSHPQEEDLYWAFADKEHEYIVPNCKDVNSKLPHLADKLPGFRCDIMMEAMASQGENEYVCWKKNQSRRFAKADI